MPRARSIWSRIAALGGPTGLEDADAFLRARAKIFTACGFWFSFLVWLYWTIYHVATGRTDLLTTPSDFANALVAAVCGACWLVLRQPRSVGVVHAIESGLALAMCFGYAALVVTSEPQHAEGVLVAWTNAMCMVLLVRAVVVPSSATRSLILGLLALGAMLSASYTVSRTPAFDGWDLTPANYVVIWGGGFLATTVVTSRVIYGLQDRVRRVMELGQYRLLDKIGEGGMGAVYRAEHRLLKRQTAVKLISPERAGKQALERFEREVMQTSRLQHPNTIAVFDYGHSPDGVFYYAMEYLEGLDLEELVTLDGPQPPGRVVHVLAQAAHALAEAHDAGLIHRDIKPANLILTHRGGIADMLKVVDFGLVKDLASESDVSMSRSDTIMGTPLYMAPEVLDLPNGLDARADLYALAAVGYFLLTGSHAIEAKTLVAVIAQRMSGRVTPPSERLGKKLPEDLEALILKSMSRNPADRHSDAAQFRQALLACECESQWGPVQADAWWTQRATAISELRRRPSEKEPSRGQLTVAFAKTEVSDTKFSDTLITKTEESARVALGTTRVSR